MGADNGANEHNDGILDLDALERTTSKEPFAFRAGGHTFHMGDPEDLDWHDQTTFESGDMSRIMPLLVDEFDEFDKLAMPGWKLERIMVAWAKHFGVSIPESEASSSSSVTTVKPSRRTSGGTTKSGSRTSRRAS